MNRHSKGDAIDIALAYKKKKLEEEGMLREEDKIKAKKVAKMINQDSKSSSSSKRMSPLAMSVSCNGLPRLCNSNTVHCFSGPLKSMGNNHV